MKQIFFLETEVRAALGRTACAFLDELDKLINTNGRKKLHHQYLFFIWGTSAMKVILGCLCHDAAVVFRGPIVLWIFSTFSPPLLYGVFQPLETFMDFFRSCRSFGFIDVF